jgi:hypothetical protein
VKTREDIVCRAIPCSVSLDCALAAMYCLNLKMSISVGLSSGLEVMEYLLYNLAYDKWAWLARKGFLWMEVHCQNRIYFHDSCLACLNLVNWDRGARLAIDAARCGNRWR